MSCHPVELEGTGAGPGQLHVTMHTADFSTEIVPGHSDGPTKKKDTRVQALALGAGLKPWVFWGMVTVATILMVYGFCLGNPFETYHNGSTL